MYEAVEKENQLRQGYLNGSDVVYSLEDLKLGAKSILAKLSKDRRSELTLGGEGSRFSYRAVLLDAQEDSGPFTYNCGVFLVPKVCLVTELNSTYDLGSFMSLTFCVGSAVFEINEIW